MPDSERSRLFVAETEAIARAYGGKQAHERATAFGQTELAYDDWLTVRTPTFKVWFGDWEAVRGVGQLRAVESLNLDDVQPLLDKKAVEEAFRHFGLVENKTDGSKVTFPINTAGKIARHKGFDTKRIAQALDRLFARAVLMVSELEEPRERHKVHIQSIEAYHHYVSPFDLEGRSYYLRFTVHQMQAGRKHPKGTRGSSFVHSSFVSEVSAYEKSANSPLSVGVWDNPVLAGDVALDAKLAQWLAAGKSESLATAPPNPRTGEPTAQAIRDYERRALRGRSLRSYGLG